MKNKLLLLCLFARNLQQIKTLDYLARLYNGQPLAEQTKNAFVIINWSWQIGLISDTELMALTDIAKHIALSSHLASILLHFF